jgi:hypothetical protein
VISHGLEPTVGKLNMVFTIGGIAVTALAGSEVDVGVVVEDLVAIGVVCGLLFVGGSGMVGGSGGMVCGSGGMVGRSGGMVGRSGGTVGGSGGTVCGSSMNNGSMDNGSVDNWSMDNGSTVDRSTVDGSGTEEGCTV